jgi:mannosyl-oligosaccharide glucosidase
MFDDFYIDTNGDKQFDGHTGYLNFWPLFLGAIDKEDARFAITFKKMVAEETGLMTPYGLRSLSIYDPYYRLGDNYWTSPIWMNINFLIIKALHSFSTDSQIEEVLRG